MDFSLLPPVLLFLGPFTGGIISFFVTGIHIKKKLKLWLAFSGAYLLALTLSGLLPHVFEHGSHEQHNNTAGYFLLAGFMFQVVIDYFTKGADHGHYHSDKDNGHHRFPFSLFIALCLHSFIEGIPLGSSLMGEDQHRTSFLWGIVLHELPAAFVLVNILKANDLKKGWLIGIVLLYSCMAPAGYMLSAYTGSASIINEHVLQHILAAVAGTFLHISTTIIFESSENHKFNSTKLIMIALGIITALLFSNH